MKQIKLLLTACGCPGASTLIRALRAAADYDGVGLEIFGVDSDSEAIGRWLCDEFAVVQPVADGCGVPYLESMDRLVERWRPDAVLPESSLEVALLPRFLYWKDNGSVPVLVSKPEAVATASNKFLMYEALKGVLPSCAFPDYRLVDSPEALRYFSKTLGCGGRTLCFKPPVAKGGRGFRVLCTSRDAADELLNRKPGDAVCATLDEMEETFEGAEFPPLLLMEYVEGQEITADALCLDGEALLVQVKTNEEARWGVTQKGELIDRPDVVDLVKRIVRAFGFSYCVNIQFIDDAATGKPKLIEINPRVSTFVHDIRPNRFPGIVMPWLAVKLALGMVEPDEVRALQDQVEIGLRFVRYFDQRFFKEDKLPAPVSLPERTNE